MKKALILTVAIFSFLHVIECQYWAPKGTTWYYEQDVFADISPVSYIKFESLGDTIINGDTVTIISESNSFRDNTPSHFYTKFDNNKVYYFNTDDDDYKLMYDFNAEKGDTVKIYCRQSEPETEPYVHIKIDSVTSTIIGEDTLKAQHFSNIYPVETSCNMQQHEPIIERIGHLKFMFPQHSWADPPYGGYLRCYEDTIIGLYKISNKDCDYHTNINTEKYSLVDVVYPNPVQDILNVDTELEITEIKIFNKLGTLVLQQKASKSINISMLPNDIYFIEIRLKDFSVTEKIIKNYY